MEHLDDIRKKISDLVIHYSNIKYAKKSFTPGFDKVLVSGKVLDHEEIVNMVNAALDGHLTTGRFNSEFEKKLSGFLNTYSLLTVNSGSSANLIAFASLTSPKLGSRAIKAGDEVITVAAGFPTTINPILLYKAVPVFVDVKLGNYNIDEEKIENAITNKTKAIMLAHTLGNPFNLNTIMKICEKYNLWLIEDSCDALGSKFNGQYVGTFGDFGTLSFYPAHHITMGEGGAVFTNNIKLKKIAESIRDWGRDCFCDPGKDNSCGRRFCWKLGNLPEGYDHKYIYSNLGFNLKITDMQAACGLGQLKKINDFIEKRNYNFNYLQKRFKDLEEFFILPKKTINSEPSWFGFPLTIRDNKYFNRNELVKYLEQKNIHSRLLFAGNVLKQPYMIGQTYKVSGKLKNTEKILFDTFWLGVFPGLDNQMLDYVVDSISEYIFSKKK